MWHDFVPFHLKYKIMRVNIINKLIQLEGLDSLPEIDPNTQDIPENTDGHVNRLIQAVIPSVLAGFYKFTRNEQNAAMITTKNAKTDWMEILFSDEKKKLVKKIASYAQVIPGEAETKMQRAAKNIVNIINEDLAKPDGKNIKKYFTEQRNNILRHLPGAIEIGDSLNDTTLDDRTNKMSGPVSGIMHSIEKTFASTDTDSNVK